MRPFAVACLLSLALGASGPAAADDSSKGVQLPGWQAEPGGSVTVTAAAIGLDGQTATATLTLAGGRPAPVRLSLTTPRFGWLGEGEPYPDRQFPELAVRLDGKPLALAAGFRAFAGAREITGLLSADHLDPFAITLTPPYLEPLDPSAPALDALAAAGAVSRRDGKTLAAWTVERTLTVSVPGGPVAVLATSWQARPAYDYLPADRTQAGPRLALYCLNATSLAEALGQPKNPGALVGREYAVPAGVGGPAPATVSLDVTGAVPDEGRRLLIAACGVEGQPVLGRDRLVGARVRPSSDGTVHVLTVGDAAVRD